MTQLVHDIYTLHEVIQSWQLILKPKINIISIKQADGYLHAILKFEVNRYCVVIELLHADVTIPQYYICGARAFPFFPGPEKTSRFLFLATILYRAADPVLTY